MRNPCRDMMEKIKAPSSLKDRVLDAAYTEQSPVSENTRHQTRLCTLDTQILNKTGRKKAMKKRVAIVLAAVISALSVTVASDSAIASVDQTITENELTVTAVQTLGDKKGGYLLFDVKAPVGTTLSEENWFEEVSIEI
ncbi:MAG: hypothetical protein QM697_03300 [Lachnospiraceae bacterium]